MITLITSLSGAYFSAGIPDLEFSIGGTQAVVVISVDDSEVYAETLYPVESRICVSDLPSMLGLYAERRLSIDVKVNITEKTVTKGEDTTVEVPGQTVVIPGAPTVTTDDTKELAFSVSYSRADVGTSASDFCSKHFLTILGGTKITALGRLEYLHYLGTDSASCTALYSDGTTADFTPEVIGGNNRYTTLDVSPDRFLTDGKQLISYTVRAGERAQRFDLDPTMPDCAPILLFDNSFGVQELLYCTGTHKVAPEYKRSSARIGGLLRNYDIEETRVFHADTGIMNTAMANWADELFRSREVYLVNIYDGNPTVGKEVVITDSKSEITNDDDNMPRFTFSYQYAQRIHNVLQMDRAGRIFDNTFDHTFN